MHGLAQERSPLQHISLSEGILDLGKLGIAEGQVVEGAELLAEVTPKSFGIRDHGLTPALGGELADQVCFELCFREMCHAGSHEHLLKEAGFIGAECFDLDRYGGNRSIYRGHERPDF